MRSNGSRTANFHTKNGSQKHKIKTATPGKRPGLEVPVGSMLEAMCAIHMSSYVDSPVKDRGWLMLIGPPGVLKTSFLEVIEDNYHNAISASNLNTTGDEC